MNSILRRIAHLSGAKLCEIAVTRIVNAMDATEIPVAITILSIDENNTYIGSTYTLHNHDRQREVIHDIRALANLSTSYMTNITPPEKMESS